MSESDIRDRCRRHPGYRCAHPGYCFMPRFKRNNGGSAPIFRHARTADCASPAIFRLLRKAAHPLGLPEKLMSPMKARCGLLVLAAIVALGGSVAVAQNLDQGKPAPKLFAESCASCHRSARGLAKGRFHLTLYLFLQKHYSSSSSSAWALTSYLESVDSGKRAAAKRPAATGAARSRLLRPPAPVPAR
jgi:hypothetical protein